MTSRSDLDKPATLMAAAVGVAIILVALPFTIAAFPQTPKSYDALWGEKALDAVTLTVPTDSGTYRATVAARDFQPASVKVDADPAACQDTYNAQLQQPVMLRLKLTETRGTATRVLKETDPFPCAEARGKGAFTVQLGEHADVAGAQALNPQTAKRVAWLDASLLNTTAASYTLEATASRAAPTVPTLPVTPPTSLGATLRLTLNGWDVAMNEHQKEVGR